VIHIFIKNIPIIIFIYRNINNNTKNYYYKYNNWNIYLYNITIYKYNLNNWNIYYKYNIYNINNIINNYNNNFKVKQHIYLINKIHLLYYFSYILY